MCSWFLEIALVRMLVCVSVCLSVCSLSWALVTSDVMWCDIGRVQLVKQVSWLFPAFNYFTWHLLLIKFMGVAILTQHVMNTCQRKLRWCGTSYKRTTRKTECVWITGDAVCKWDRPTMMRGCTHCFRFA